MRQEFYGVVPYCFGKEYNNDKEICDKCGFCKKCSSKVISNARGITIKELQ